MIEGREIGEGSGQDEGMREKDRKRRGTRRGERGKDIKSVCGPGMALST